ncbi:antibiotic biosynthesis monooxygenase family protein [Streptomyces sp. NPDC087440]|uniref:antibiotic biosynthesis monooxygenase family protein n=1 Tax=Streptomyces sp. NPDC087440 TaxID=3365790 RepID=UPI0037FF8CB5
MPRRDADLPLTLVHRFTVHGDTQRFEERFRDHCQYLRARPGFAFLVTLRLLERDHVYVHLAHWRTRSAFQDTVRDPVFQEHVRRLEPLVETEADQAYSMDRTLYAEAAAGASNVVLVRAVLRSPKERGSFARKFAALGAHCADLGGFGGTDLLRSTVDPLLCTGLQWWHEEEDCERALGDVGYRNGLRSLSELAAITTERTRHLAYEHTSG